MKRLLVIVSDRISNIIEKGELIECYYNPNNYFDEVGIILTNDDVVCEEKFAPSVGTAKFTIYNVPTGKGFLFKTLGWRPFLMRKWAEQGVSIAREFKPDIIRCYGNRWSGYLSSYVKKKLNIPYVLSMHEAPDNIVKSEGSFLRTWQYKLLESMGLVALRDSDLVIASYDSIVEDLKRRNVMRYVTIHNAVNQNYISEKEDYRCKRPFKIISVGRLIKIKNPVNLIKAVAELEEVYMEIIGDGSEYQTLVCLTQKLNCQERIKFIKSVSNDEVCKKLKECDLFAIHCDGIGVPKTVIEAWLSAVPVLSNFPASGNTTEYINGENIFLVADTKEGYMQGIKKMMNHEDLRKQLGQGGLNYAQKEFYPKEMSNRVIAAYETVLKDKERITDEKNN